MRSPLLAIGAAVSIAILGASPIAGSPAELDVPESAPAIVATSGNGTVVLSWSPVAGATGYRVYRSENGRWEPEPHARTSATTYKGTNLVNGTTYSFTVAAYNKHGNGPLSLAVTITPIAPPSDVAIKPGDGRITLTWTPSAGATSYTVYRRVENLAFDELATGVLAPPFIDMNLTNRKVYHYRLRAVAGAAESEPSLPVSARAGRQ